MYVSFEPGNKNCGGNIHPYDNANTEFELFATLVGIKIPPPEPVSVELTLDQIAEKFGIDIKTLKIIK